MKLRRTSFLFLFFVALTANAQKGSDIIMTIDDTPVYSNEFVRVYKKNLELVQDESQKTVNGYLDLFIDYKLKVAAAYNAGLNEKKGYREEFSKYEEQLSRNYLYEDKVTTDLARKAYERGQYDVKASHILTLVSYDSPPQDTLKAYNKIKEALVKARAGEQFSKLAKEYTEERGGAERGGDLGYFGTFTMVHQFEDAAYETSVGGVSDIIRTQFGYHILKVFDRREHEPDVTVSHIMISSREDDARTFDPKERINEINGLLKQGSKFEDLARQYSEDKGSSVNGGKLTRFSKGKLRSKKFEELAYGLEKPGDLSEPFETEFGWHILRLEQKHKTETFEEQKEVLEKKIGEGSRSKIVTSAVNDRIKEKYDFKGDDSFKLFFANFITDSIFKKSWNYNENFAEKDRIIFVLGDDYKVTYGDFATYIKGIQNKRGLAKSITRIIDEGYEAFETEQLKRFFRDVLEKTNEEYAAIISEYRDGLLIFDVMILNVWDKAKKDTIGSQDYYKANKGKYQWEKRIDADIISSSKEVIIKEASAMLSNGKTIDEIKNALNTDKHINVIASSGKYELDDQNLPGGFSAREGLSKAYAQNGNYVVVNVKKIVSPSNKLFEEVKGRVISDYQKQLEKDWLKELRATYKVVVNKKALKKLKKQLE